ncbi:MAG: hypothetical protein LBD45_08520 [Bacteroidales bacterium]|jgi:hypothetical protein|nr:hypothetical protein [Bacteroidales bacterium]
MGRFLAIGLIYEADVFRDEMNSVKADIADVTAEMQKSLGYDIAMYDVVESNDFVEFTLKKEILHTNLYSFLKEFYPIIYSDKSSVYSEEYQKILDLLETDKFDECMNIAKSRSNMTFRFDSYAEPQFMHVGEVFRKSITIQTEIINLYYGYGKIVTEGINDIERIFEHFARKALKNQPIAQTLRLYVSG